MLEMRLSLPQRGGGTRVVATDVPYRDCPLMMQHLFICQPIDDFLISLVGTCII